MAVMPSIQCFRLMLIKFLIRNENVIMENCSKSHLKITGGL